MTYTPTLPSRQTPKLRVLVVDDSSICRSVLRAVLEMDGDVEVVGEGTDAFSAVALVEALSPDLVTMDVRMPGKSGLEAVEQIMARRPVPILVVTTEPLTDQAGIAFRAIENGALDIVPKPSISDALAGAAIRVLVRQLARTPVFQRATEEHPSTIRPMGSSVFEFLVVIAGHGGMPSVMALLSRLTVLPSFPIVVHQPVREEQAAPYAEHIAQLSRHRIALAAGPRATCKAGEVLLVLGGCAVMTSKDELRIEPSGEPNASALLESIAALFGASAIGVALAGKGSDGVSGLGALRQTGAITYVESPLSATINELPMAAVDADVVGGIYPIAQLAERLDAHFTIG